MLTVAYPDRLERDDAALGGRREAEAGTAYLTGLILLTVSYQLWLCFAYTSTGLGGNRMVIIAEIALLAACLPYLLRRLPMGFWLVGTLILLNWLALGLIRASFDPKPVRDLLVPLIFLGVGLAAAGEHAADRVLRRVIWVVLAVALFEFFFLDLFTRFFDIYGYYNARGVGDPDMGLYRDDRLVASGIRPEGIGRTVMAFLGPHRASSVFIEPVSFGNFAAICAAWGLAKPREDWRTGAFFVLASVAMMVLSDSRFALAAIGLLVLLRLLLVRGAEPVGIAFPFLAVLAVVLIAIARGGEYSDSFLGRLTLTGRALLGLPGTEMFGMTKPDYGYFDMGYTYVIANFGLVACLALWGAFWMLPRLTDTARRFHVYTALYLTLILCVSGTSAFAFKTSAPLWFLLGSLVGHVGQTERRLPSPPGPLSHAHPSSIRRPRCEAAPPFVPGGAGGK